MQLVKEKLKTRIEELEDEMKKLREDLEKEKFKTSVPNEEEVCVPWQHFTSSGHFIVSLLQKNFKDLYFNLSLFLKDSGI